MNRYQSSNLIKNGGFLVSFFFLLLLLLNRGFLTVAYQGFNGINLFYIVIITGIIGIGYAAKQFEKNTETNWKFGQKSWFFSIIASIFFFLALLMFSLQEIKKSDSLEIIALFMMIIGNSSVAVEFFFLKKDLTLKFEEKKVIKKPDNIMIYAFALQGLAFFFILLRYILYYFYYFTSLDIIVVLFSTISVILMFIASIKLNIIFRAYPYLYEKEFM